MSSQFCLHSFGGRNIQYSDIVWLKCEKDYLSLSEKHNVIHKHDENAALSQKQCTESLRIQSSTLQTIIKHCDLIFEVARGGCKRKKLPHVKNFIYGPP